MNNNEVRSIRAAAGAEWILEGFAIWRRSLGGLGLMGAVYGLVSALGVMLALSGSPLGGALQMALIIAAPLLMAGLVWAAREVAEGRQASLAHYGIPPQQGKTAALLSTLLPQVALGLLLVVVLRLLLGQEDLQLMQQALIKIQSAKPGTPVDPQVFAGLPAGRLLAFLLIATLMAFGVFFLTFVAIPDILFGGRGGIAAMRRSLRACLRNLPAVMVFFLMLMVTLFGLMLLMSLVSMLVQLVAGEVAAAMMSQVLLMAVLMPVLAGASWKAWTTMLGTGTNAGSVSPPAGVGQLQA